MCVYTRKYRSFHSVPFSHYVHVSLLFRCSRYIVAAYVQKRKTWPDGEVMQVPGLVAYWNVVDGQVGLSPPQADRDIDMYTLLAATYRQCRNASHPRKLRNISGSVVKPIVRPVHGANFSTVDNPLLL